jgi:hypothetical protein
MLLYHDDAIIDGKLTYRIGLEFSNVRRRLLGCHILLFVSAIIGFVVDVISNGIWGLSSSGTETNTRRAGPICLGNARLIA